MSEKKNDKVIHTMVDRAPWWVPWTFLFCLFFGWAVYQFVYTASVEESNREARQVIREASIDSCERVNRLRGEVNHHGEVLRQVLDAAVDTTENAQFARELLELQGQIEQIPLTECEQAFPEQIEQAGYESVLEE